MVDISRLSQSFTLIAPAAVNPAAKVLRDLGSSASPVTTDLRQQSNEIRGFGNSLIEQLQSTTSIETARGLSNSAEISKTIADAVNAASQRMSIVAALNNQRETQLQKQASSGSMSPYAAALTLMQELGAQDEEGFDFGALIGRGSSSRVKTPAPLEVLATAVKGPKFGQDIFERGIQPMIGAGGGLQLSVQRRALRDETVTVRINPEDETSTGVPFCAPWPMAGTPRTMTASSLLARPRASI